MRFKGQNLGYLSPIFLEAKFGAPTRISEANFGAKPPSPRPPYMEVLVQLTHFRSGFVYIDIEGNHKLKHLRTKFLPGLRTYAMQQTNIPKPLRVAVFQTCHVK